MNHKILGTVVVVAPLALVASLLIVILDAHRIAADACRTGDSAAALPVDQELAGLVPGYTVEQLSNAATIVRVGAQMGGLRQADQVIAVMVALGESSLRNLTYGDQVGPDSLGLFQQRANGAWGSREDRLDPATASRNFYRALMQVQDRYTLEPTIAGNRVQRNADPYHYRPYLAPARQIVTALTGAGGAVPVKYTENVSGLGNVRPQLVNLVIHITQRFEVDRVGGYRPSATDPAGHPAGLAADFMVPLNEQGKALGAQIAAYAQANHQMLGIDYIIWRSQIWSLARAAEGWRPMADRGSLTANHEDHVHINVLPDGAAAASPNAQTACGVLSVAGGSGWIIPLAGAQVTSPFGPRIHPVRGDRSFHDGDDYAASCGTPFRAAKGGLVVKAGTDSIYGHQIIVDHGGGVQSRYGHMYANGVLVRVGATVTAGQAIGLVGSDGLSTGCHLHFSITVDGAFQNPSTYLAQASNEE